jgi:hypothetical protein
LVAVLETVPAGPASGQQPTRQLTVHLAQANNDSPYSFIRAKFEPGEVDDPWAVRFFDARGEEVPYFVWDSVTWKVAHKGRADWGHRYALVNHHPGDAPEALEMRPRRLAAATNQLPELGAVLAAQDEAARRSSESVCAALYLVRYRVAPFGKDKLTLRVFATRQTEPKRRRMAGAHIEERLTAAAGALVFENLPDRPAVRWNGTELFRYAGFEIGDKAAGKDRSITYSAYADANQPFAVEIEEGIITKLSIWGQTQGRARAPMSWQCLFWLFPEGSYVALTGFSFDNSEGYRGGGLSPAVWEIPQQPKEVHAPLWEKPWWLHQLSDVAFVAIHQFGDTPLAVGYGNNPFNTSTPDSFQVRQREKTKGRGAGVLELHWTYDTSDKRLARLFHPCLDNADSLALEERFVKWRPRFDWLYRQYVVAVGENAAQAEKGIRQVLGAACGWVDRPFRDVDIAELVVQFSLRKAAPLAAAPYQQAWPTLPASLRKGDRAAVAERLEGSADPMETAAAAMGMIQKHTAAGGSPIQGTTEGGGEGWHNNPAYAAVDVPVALRFMEHFRLFSLARRRKPEYRDVLVEWSDFSLATLGGRPLDWKQFRASARTLWPNRVVMLVPLMLRAYAETSDEKYARAAKVVFDDLFMTTVETNPHGYFWAWGHAPRKAEPFDLNYNVAAFDRGLVDFWTEAQCGLIDRQRAARFVAAQARYLAFSGQLLDTLEVDNMTAVQSQYPGGVPFAVGQVALFLYDDFPFYRGLAGEVIRWAVIDDGGTVDRREGRRNLYSLKIGSRGLVFWAYGIGRDAPLCQTAREMRARWLTAKPPTPDE